MAKLDIKDLQRIAVSAIGALALSATCIIGVSSPAHAAGKTPAAAVRAA